MPRRADPIVQRGPDIAGLAAVLADPSRAAMLDALMDGEAHAIGRLARTARVTAATASSHLRRLVDAELVHVELAGRERRVRIASPAVAHLLEQLATLAPPTRAGDVLRFARTCYDHLAGVLGVLVTGALVDRGWLHRTSDSLEPAPPLFDWLAAHERPVVLDAKRPLSRACLDGTERVPHVAGQVGAAIAAVFVGRGWVVRVRDSRALRLTERGRVALARELGVTLPQQRRG